MEPTTNQMVLDLCSLESHEYRLSEWEIEFVDSCAKQIEAGREMSPKQIGKITQIWRKAFAG